MQSLSDSAFYALGYFMFSCYTDNIEDRTPHEVFVFTRCSYKRETIVMTSKIQKTKEK